MNHCLALCLRLLLGTLVLLGAGYVLILAIGCAFAAFDESSLSLAGCAAIAGFGFLILGNAALRLLFNRPRPGGGLLPGFVFRLWGLFIAVVPFAWLAMPAEKRPVPLWVVLLLLPLFALFSAAYFARAARTDAHADEKRETS